MLGQGLSIEQKITDADSSVAQADAAADVFFDKAQCITVATLCIRVLALAPFPLPPSPPARLGLPDLDLKGLPLRLKLLLHTPTNISTSSTTSSYIPKIPHSSQNQHFHNKGTTFQPPKTKQKQKQRTSPPKNFPTPFPPRSTSQPIFQNPVLTTFEHTNHSSCSTAGHDMEVAPSFLCAVMAHFAGSHKFCRSQIHPFHAELVSLGSSRDSRARLAQKHRHWGCTRKRGEINPSNIKHPESLISFKCNQIQLNALSWGKGKMVISSTCLVGRLVLEETGGR